MLENLYTTKMTSDKKALQKRFAKIRSGSGRLSKLAAVVVSVAIAVTMLCATIVMAAMESRGEIVYEVYNGDTKIDLQNQPFIYDDNYYLPLRETLNAFGITDIEYNNGMITIKMPDTRRSDRIWANTCELSLTSDTVIYTDGTAGKNNMNKPPVLKNGTTYVTEYFFSDLIRAGQIPGYRLNVIRDLSPESYYSIGEEVFIGTWEEQENFKPDGNGLVKRIIVDENRNTVAVIPVENQEPDKLWSVHIRKGGNIRCASNYTGMLSIGSYVAWNADGKAVYQNTDIMIYQAQSDSDIPMAFIPTVWQINIPKPDLSELNRN